MPTGPLIIPNFHVILIHYPLALISLGTLIELFAFLWRGSTFRQAGRWMILIGALALVPAALSGLHAMADVNRPDGTPEDATWADARADSPVQGQAWEQMREHAWLNADACVILLFIVIIYLGSSDKWRSRLHWPFLILLLVGQGFLVAGAWHGGEMVYHHAVAVETQDQSASAVSEESMEGRAKGNDKPSLVDRIGQTVEPMDTHVMLAGVTIALALAALGLSMRAGARQKVSIKSARPPVATGAIGSALNPHARPGSELGEFDTSWHDQPLVAVRMRSRLPVARIWLAALVLGVVTALAGVWTLAHGADTWNWHHVGGSAKQLWHMVSDQDTAGGSRRLAHTLAGGAIVALLLLLTLVGRWAATRQFLLGLLALLLLVAVVAQIWLGSLLMFDTPAGPLGQFNPGSATPATVPAMTSERGDESRTPPATHPAVTAP